MPLSSISSFVRKVFLCEVLFAESLYLFIILIFLFLIKSRVLMLKVTLNAVLPIVVHFGIFIINEITFLVHRKLEFAMLILLFHFEKLSDQEYFIEAIFDFLDSIHFVS
jgi:hypothetical protein